MIVGAMLTIRRRGDDLRDRARPLEDTGLAPPGLRNEEQVGDTSTVLPRDSKTGTGARIRAAAAGGEVEEGWGTAVSA